MKVHLADLKLLHVHRQTDVAKAMGTFLQLLLHTERIKVDMGDECILNHSTR
jgi:hypothetical protein